MEGPYVTPLDLSDGFAPTKVTFGIDFPGCSTLDPIKVSYHNTDWFEPGRVNNFRQFQKPSDVNSHLAPVCVCLKPEVRWTGKLCLNTSEGTPPYEFNPPLYVNVLGLDLKAYASAYIERVRSTYPALNPSEGTVAHTLRMLDLFEEGVSSSPDLKGPYPWGARIWGGDMDGLEVPTENNPRYRTLTEASAASHPCAFFQRWTRMTDFIPEMPGLSTHTELNFRPWILGVNGQRFLPLYGPPRLEVLAGLTNDWVLPGVHSWINPIFALYEPLHDDYDGHLIEYKLRGTSAGSWAVPVPGPTNPPWRIAMQAHLEDLARNIFPARLTLEAAV